MARRKRESIARKARRLTMTKGSVRIVRAGYKGVEAVVTGDSDAYVVRIQPGFRYCSCPAHGTCSHMVAVLTFWAPADEKLARWIEDQLRPTLTQMG